MTEQELTEIEKLCDAATPWPWPKWPINFYDGTLVPIKDIDFLVASRTALPKLITTVRKYREALEFYADIANRDFWRHPQGDGEGFIWKDGGETARKALEE